MLELLKLRKDINILFGYIKCLMAKSEETHPLVATEWSVNHTNVTGNPYTAGTYVFYNGNVYKCLFNNEGILPTNTTYWLDLGEGHLLAEEQSDWNATGGRRFILNKPTNTSDFTNDGQDGTSPYATLQDLVSNLQDLDSVLTNGNISQIDAYVGGIFLYNPNFPSGNGYVSITGDKNRFNFYDKTGFNIAHLGQDTLTFIDPVVTTRIFQIKKPTAIAANRIATFQDASGTVAYLSDIPTIPTVGTWGALNYPTWTTGTPFVKMTAVGTFTLDTNTYLTQIAADLLYYPLLGNPAGYLTSAVTSVGAIAPIISSGGNTPVISTSMSTNKLIGRSTAGTGVMEEITIGSGLNLSGGTLSASGIGAGGILHGTTSGTDTYTVTIAGATAYADGDAYLIRFPNGNTGSATINISGLGAVGLYRNNDGPVIGGDIWNGAEMLCIYNSTIGGFQLIGTSPNAMYAYITNADSVTITKGQVVYAFGGQGDRMTVKLASNVGDLTSAQTVGVVLSTSIAANQRGVIITQGLLDGLSILPTSTFSDGDPLYLGVTPGSITNIKPYAPNHLVYLGNVTTASNGSAGRWYVRVQNGYELDELHDVDLISNAPTNGQVLTYESLTGLWKNQNVPTELPTQTGNTGKFLFTNGTNASWNSPSRHYKLGFNNIAEYTVVGGSGVQNLGAGTLGMSLVQDLSSMLYTVSGSNYVINCRVITAEQFGGTANQLGLRVTYSSATGTLSVDQLLVANRIIQFGSNNAIQVANLNFTIPINYLGQPTNYFRFDVIMNRLPAGNTSVFSSELIFST